MANDAAGIGGGGGDTNGIDKKTAGEALPDAVVDPHGLAAGARDDGLFVMPTVAHFLSDSRIPQALDHLVRTALRENRVLENILISGDEGSGTTLLARALVRDYAPAEFLEIDAATGWDPMVLSSMFSSIGPGGVLLVRHIDRLDADSDFHLGHAMGMSAAPPKRPRRRRGPELRDPDESDIDRVISESARLNEQRVEPATPPHRFTVIATTHRVRDIGALPMRRFTHTFELRSEPRAMSRALVRAMRNRGIAIAPESTAHLVRVLGSLPDVARTIGQCLMLRRDIDGWSDFDAERMRIVLEDDVGERVPGDHFLWALRRHLGARRLAGGEQGMRDDEVDGEVMRIARETGWSPRIAREALNGLVVEGLARRGAA